MRPEPYKPEMNVTPLVDVVLVLLIIFMVVAPHLEAGANVDLPAAQNPDRRGSTDLEPITVSVDAGGVIYLDRERIDLTVLGSRLKETQSATPGRKLVLKGDRRARYGRLREVFKECQAIALKGVSLQVGDVEEPAHGS